MEYGERITDFYSVTLLRRHEAVFHSADMSFALYI